MLSVDGNSSREDIRDDYGYAMSLPCLCILFIYFSINGRLQESLGLSPAASFHKADALASEHDDESQMAVLALCWFSCLPDGDTVIHYELVPIQKENSAARRIGLHKKRCVTFFFSFFLFFVNRMKTRVITSRKKKMESNTQLTEARLCHTGRTSFGQRKYLAQNLHKERKAWTRWWLRGNERAAEAQCTKPFLMYNSFRSRNFGPFTTSRPFPGTRAGL